MGFCAVLSGAPQQKHIFEHGAAEWKTAHRPDEASMRCPKKELWSLPKNNNVKGLWRHGHWGVEGCTPTTATSHGTDIDAQYQRSQVGPQWTCKRHSFWRPSKLALSLQPCFAFLLDIARSFILETKQPLSSCTKPLLCLSLR